MNKIKIEICYGTACYLLGAAKMAGFYLGRHFHRLPGFMVRAFTDNRSFWEKDHEAEVRAWL